MQGSYPNGTAVEPVDGGEYDVDIVAICVDQSTTADAALDDLVRRFEDNGNYADRIVAKAPCVRLEYAGDNVGKFHVDVVPVRENIDPTSIAPLDAPRRGKRWHETAPSEYTQWCAARGAEFGRTVKIMKRWRDEQQTVRAAIKSIVLQVLVSECMPSGTADDQTRLVETFHRLHSRLSSLSSPPAVMNPVLPTENLASRWSQASFESFVRELKEAVEISGRAVDATDQLQAIDAWRELLGEDFPAMSTADLGLEISDYSHAHTFAAHGWRVGYDPRYRVRVQTGIKRGRYGAYRAIPEGQLIFAGNQLRFEAVIKAHSHVEVWWQVANTGGHARDQLGGLRGEFFKAKTLKGDPSPQQNVNWERTSYTGVHLIRTVLVRDRTVVAHSEWHQVNVFARNHPFRP